MYFAPPPPGPPGQLHHYGPPPPGYGAAPYGAPVPFEAYGPPGMQKPAGRHRRFGSGHINVGAICICLFAPWLLFCAMSSLLSFYVHYFSSWVCYSLAALALLLVAIPAWFAVDAIRHHRPDTPHSWFVFLLLSCVIAWGAGVISGGVNFFHHMEPYYSINHMNDYTALNPGAVSAQQVMDAGRVGFALGTKLDLSKSMMFKNVERYCVAPITSRQGKPGPSGSYDFWAVGLNCCPGDGMSFQCGEFMNPQASAGLRLMRADQDAFYNLAVQQAEAEYGITAAHPLFFYWMRDPKSEVASWLDYGLQNYLLGAFTFFAFQLFFVLVFIVIFPQMLS